ncbi:multidrug efflux SMR transporter [Luteolibacter ambystomatis]|uniref:Guanidinium exporter n=1 Tax=Luteolibacter ambystomatis TaxID=2824561 RepID=A0A975J2V3_9BACT|nr:multidrug efflux SMR transporter [Luteolibacter ambystomatis]QUE53038.1 multidrug efflux SMR transporter [Luteolibacter ambystomatis]
MSPWIILVLAGLLETCWAMSLKHTEGFTRPGPTAFFLVTLAGSMILLSMAVKHLPMGTAYAVWVGIGAIGAVIGSIFLYQEPLPMMRLLFLIMLVGSIVGLKATAAH